ncbi:hypothetical protein [Terrabacter sp. NPDC080008]|uniref:hypothetical protein n=1 Tax=Terrabacter sp. NPDC080008 TaxID=3155176 RepID=UPI00344EA1D4
MSSEGPRPRDPRLELYRDAVWELSRNGRLEAHLVTQVTYFRYWPFGRRYHEWLFCRVCWLDGRSEPPEEDYEPWTIVPELEQGKFESSYAQGGMFDARPLEGSARDLIWERYGPP